MKFLRFFLIVLALVLVAGTSSGEIYRWVDENGVVHFSDSPTESQSETSREEDVSSSGSDSEENVSSPEPNANDNSPPAEEPRKITLDSDLFKLLDKSKPARISTHAPTVEIYETRW
jgi:hypothetical protein